MYGRLSQGPAAVGVGRGRAAHSALRAVGGRALLVRAHALPHGAAALLRAPHALLGLRGAGAAPAARALRPALQAVPAADGRGAYRIPTPTQLKSHLHFFF